MSGGAAAASQATAFLEEVLGAGGGAAGDGEEKTDDRGAGATTAGGDGAQNEEGDEAPAMTAASDSECEASTSARRIGSLELGPDSAWCALSQVLGSALLKAGCQLAVACAGARSGWIQIRVDLADNIRVGYVRWACCAASPRSQRAREVRGWMPVHGGEKKGACNWLLQVAGGDTKTDVDAAALS